MDKPKDLLCLEGISCISYSKNYTHCVLSKKDNNLYIYEIKNKVDVSTWELKSTLSAHLIYVSAVDWHPETNCIISASHDRNILVWSFNTTKNAWIPDIVQLNHRLAVLDVKWSARGDKFVAATGSKYIATGYYENDNNWWMCKVSKEHRSAVTTVRFDNTGLFVLSGSTDLRAYITSAYIPEVDDKYTYDNLIFPKENFGEVIHQLSVNGWVNSVCWSLSNQYCFVATHDSYLHVIKNEDKSTFSLPLNHAPISHLVAAKNNVVFGIGYDRHIYVYELDQNEWKMSKSITKSTGDSNAKNEMGIPMGLSRQNSGMSIQDRLKQFQGGFQNKKQSLIVTTTVQKNIHSANINSVININDTYLVTSDYAGFIKIWNL